MAEILDKNGDVIFSMKGSDLEAVSYLQNNTTISMRGIALEKCKGSFFDQLGKLQSRSANVFSSTSHRPKDMREGSFVQCWHENYYPISAYDFSGAIFKDCFIKVSSSKADGFHLCNFRAAQFINCTITGNFHYCDLSGVDFSNSNTARVKFGDNWYDDNSHLVSYGVALPKKVERVKKRIEQIFNWDKIIQTPPQHVGGITPALQQQLEAIINASPEQAQRLLHEARPQDILALELAADLSTLYNKVALPADDSLENHQQRPDLTNQQIADIVRMVMKNRGRRP
ncbi:MAG: pentapeptide repeat-containing protein [Alphaproteobacteria bacterium]